MMNVAKLAAISGAAVLGCLLLASHAWADVTYTYTGNDFSFVSGGDYTFTDRVSGTLTISSALPDDQSTMLTVTPTLFSFTDGVQTITNSNADTTGFTFETNASGDIIAWALEVGTGSTADGGQIFSENNPQEILDSGSLVDLPTLDALGENSNDPGTWTSNSPISAVPEPASFALLGIGIATLGLSRRRRFALTIS